MLYELVSFSDQIGPFNVFKYITFRTGGAIFTAVLFVMLFGPGIIDLLRDLRERERLTYILISHDLGVVRSIADRVNSASGAHRPMFA